MTPLTEGDRKLGHDVQLGEAVARVRFTTAADGDLLITLPDEQLRPRRAAIVDAPWTWLRQVHRAEVVTVDQPGEMAGEQADAAVTAARAAPLAIHTADCAPVVLLADEGIVGAVHAGWRGVAAGVLPAALARLRALGAGNVSAILGPCIHPECYEFGETELDRLAASLGRSVVGTTRWGTPALDLPAAVAASLGPGVPLDVIDVCTACDTGLYSHRARGDTGRQAAVVWLDGS